MLEESLLELAKVNVREAMRNEIKLNEGLIETYNDLSRNSKREWKIEALTAIVRNETLKSFLSLDLETQQPEKLRHDYPTNDRFNRYVLQTSSTSYAQSIYYEAKRKLYLDYTHGRSQFRNRVFLDEPLPELPIPPAPTLFIRIVEVVGNIIGYGFAYSFYALILFVIIWMVFFDDSGSKSSSNYNPNTFDSGGISGGNSSGKSVSNAPQVMDHTGQAGFGNGGMSGHDAPSSGSSNTFSNSTQNNPVNTVPETQPPKVITKVTADYYLPMSGGNGVFSIKEGETIENLIEGDEIVLSIYKPNGEFIYGYWNGNLLDGQSHNWNDEEVSYTFWPKAGENEIRVVNDEEEYLFYFNTMELNTTEYFTLGSSQEEVLKVMGEVGKGREVYIGDEAWWFYDDKLSYICFDSTGKVKAWRNTGDFLKVTLGDKEPNAPKYSIGSSKEEVIKYFGTPLEILNEHTWLYGEIVINFNSSGKVISYIDDNNYLITN